MIKKSPAIIGASLFFCAFASTCSGYAQEENQDLSTTKRKTSSEAECKEISLSEGLLSDFTNDSHFSLKFRNAYFKRSYHDSHQSDQKQNAGWHQWAQGVTADFVSGYIQDFIGADFSLYGAMKLNGSHPENAGDELLHKIKHGKKYADNYSRIGRLNAKFRIGGEKDNALLRYGLIGVNTSILTDSNNRLLESSFRGASMNSRLGSLNDLQLYGVYVDRISTRSGNGYDRLLSGNGKTIGSIQVYGAGYTIADNESSTPRSINVKGEYANSANYVKHYFGQVDYDTHLNETFGILANFQYRGAESGGKLWDKAVDGFDKKASQTNTNLKASINNLTLAMTYGYTKANNDKSHRTGKGSYSFNQKLAANEYGSGTLWTARQISLFNYDKENVWQVMTGYDFSDSGIPGFNVSLTHSHGHGMNKATGFKKERETDLSLNYIFQEPALNGFSITIDHAWYALSKDKGTSVNVSDVKLRDLKAYANYKVAVF